ncbi:MAG: TPM domain-containing protein [Gammaproteobacteria bacterium]
MRICDDPAVRAALVAAALWLTALTAAPAASQALRPIPPLEARVTDLTGTLSQAEQAQLESQLAEFESQKGAQIAVLMVPTTEPEAIEQYSIRVVDAWKLGRAQPDDGALLLVAKDDRNMRIEVGRGLEGALTDLVSRRIIADTITPFFRQDDFAGGIGAGVGQMIRIIEGEPLPAPDHQWGGGPERLGGILPLLFAVVLVGSMVLRALFGRALGSAATGGITGVIVWWVTKLLGLAIGVGIFAVIASLFLGVAGARRWSSRPGHGGWTSGGWGRAGAGSGGFRGGGGSFGGGGASGRW